MKIQYLHTLRAVVRAGGIAAAARDVHLSVSAVSLQLRQLEAYFRRPLMDRSGRSAQPNPFAGMVVAAADSLLDQIDALRNDADHVQQGRVRIGVTESAETSIFPRAYAELCSAAPQIDIAVQRGHSAALMAAVKAGSLDLALMVRPDGRPSNQLIWTELWCQPFVLLLPQDAHPIDVRQALRAHPWIRLSRELTTGRIAARYVDKLIPHCKALIDLESVDSAVALVGRGAGVTVVPRPQREVLLGHRVKERDLGAHGPVRHLVLAKRKADVDNRRIDIVEAAFVRAARELQA